MAATLSCCRCGFEPDTIPYCVGGASYKFHCFCCAKSPPKYCAYCGTPGDLNYLKDLNKKHSKCFKGLHYFVYTEPWHENANPDLLGRPSLKQLLPELDRPVSISSHVSEEEAQEPQNTPTEEPLLEPTIVHEEEMHHSQLDLVISKVRTLSEEFNIDAQDSQDTVEGMRDRKERNKGVRDMKPATQKEQKWVTTKEVLSWPRCPRCECEHTINSGWIKHAQECAQDPRYNKPTFLMYCHTKGWCNYLVRDSLWEKHSDPSTGSCDICRSFSRQLKPLPYMPEPPPRPNEAVLAKRRRQNYRTRKRKQREL
ncbi:uncharacterized protein LOC122617449 isoform X1 [Drosophila teissieri]|uniref:uncharacterized protein LOC122617449 isoform X1 n=1 Tax=Drosophila teissieri TaxID=7243 RepID=UPI001CBA0095|nr:uncharacterized protein LOC122617449 isoform X1 [Drosophila teissieri]